MTPATSQLLALSNSLAGAAPADSSCLLAHHRAIVAGGFQPVPLFPKTLDRLTRAGRIGSVTLLAGLEGIGKSYFLSQNMIEWLRLGIPCAGRFLEDTTRDYLYRTLVQLTGRPELQDEDWQARNSELWVETYTHNLEFLDAIAGSFEADDSGEVTQREILDWAQDRVDQGYRAIVIDPLTAADREGAKPFEVDGRFIRTLKGIVSGRAAAIVTTHLAADGVKFAGGMDLVRFCTTALELQANADEKSFDILDSDGRKGTFTPDRIFKIRKARYGPGTGMRIACRFDPAFLTMNAAGVIVRSEEAGQ